MKNLKLLIASIILIVSVFEQKPVNAQYIVNGSTFGNGGAVNVDGSDFSLYCTAGQAFIGLTGNGSYNVALGFWYKGAANFTGIEDLPGQLQRKFQLYQNYPNPFNPLTNIKFVLPKAAFVTLEIYNYFGEKVESLVSGNLSSGEYSIIWDASEFGSGVYFYRLKADGFVQSKKLILLR